MRTLVVGGFIVLSAAVTPGAHANEDACTELQRGYNVMLPCSTFDDVMELLQRGYN